MQRAGSIFIALVVMAGWAGCVPPPACAAAPAATTPQPPRQEGGEHVIFGKILGIDGSQLRIETRSKTVIQVDTKPAAESHLINIPAVGRAVRLHGAYDAKGVLHADTVQRAKDSELLWPADK
jgi:hypothetical protein